MTSPPFVATKHPRGAGGLFAATAASKTDRPTGAWAAGPIGHGTGKKGAPDPRVRALQKQLNALGLTDERGRPLLVDGIDGAHTTAAVKKFQKAHGMAPTGVVDAKLMVAILSAKPAPKPVRARDRMRASAPRKTPAKKSTPPKTTTPKAPPKPLTSTPSGENKRGQSRAGLGT
jgi:peptidoglycan hydrolase-like protein with peptidoglycan-binding domain